MFKVGSLTSLFFVLLVLTIGILFQDSAPAQLSQKDLKFVDSNNKNVGFFFAPNMAMRKFEGLFVILPFNQFGNFTLAIESSILMEYAITGPGELHDRVVYATEDCTGPAYWLAFFEPQLGSVLNNTLFYGHGPTQEITIRSTHHVIASEACREFNLNLPFKVRELATFDMTTLNLTGPFKLVRD